VAHHPHEGHRRRGERVIWIPSTSVPRAAPAQLLPDGERLLPRRARRQVHEDLELDLLSKGSIFTRRSPRHHATAPANSAG
jgi:hypothetical protein